MSNLQALNVQCEDDNLSSTQDKLIEWLRHGLSSSCMITRDTHHIRDIRLWIR
jgi:hypothetical protein